MLHMLLLGALVCGALPDLSRGYFPNLARPPALELKMSRGDGPVILIVIDALRPDHLPAYGAKRNTAPVLTQLADEGVLFTNYFANGNWTRPSTATMLTGLPPRTHGVERDRDHLASQFTTLAELLDRAGVPTGAVVGNGNAGSAFGLGRGFKYYADTVKHWKGLPSAEQVTELALPFVREHIGQPFFLMLFFVDIHDPYRAPGAYENMFVKNRRTALIRSPHWELGRYSRAQIERMRATYDGALRYTDDTLGRFFAQLRELGIYDKATILVTADHGEAFGEHGVFLHGHHLYDELIRIPLMVRAPQMSQRGVYNHYLFQTLDLFPTIAGLFRVPVAPTLPGVDIMQHLAVPELNSPRRTVISEFHNFGIKRRSIRTYTKKLIIEEPADAREFRATVGRPSLLPSVSFKRTRLQAYNLALDPRERRNLVTASGKNVLQRAYWQRLVATLQRHRPYERKQARAGHAAADALGKFGGIDAATYEDLRTLGYVQ